MMNEINEEIMKRVDNVKEENIKNFLKEALVVEYKFRDRNRPHVKKDYLKLINKYFGDINDY